MSSAGFAKGLVLVLAGAAAGAVAGSIVAHRPGSLPGPDGATGEALLDRIDALEKRVAATAERAPRRRGRVEIAASGEAAGAADPIPVPQGALGADSGGAAPTAGDGDSPGGDRATGAAQPRPSPEFVAAVRMAIDELKREAAEGATDQKLQAERQKKAAELRKTIPEIATRLGLTEEETRELGRTAWAGVEAVLQARTDGRSDDEIGAVEREGRRAVRDFLGSARYRDMRKLELDAVARPTIAKVASLAGVDPEQRDRIEKLLTTHIDRLVDDEVRLRTEELPDEERSAIRDRLNAANTEAWDRIRNEILDADQRERVPVRLR